MSLRIKKNDQVVVIAGKNRGTKSRVLFVVPDKDRAVVENVNMVKRHTRARGQGKPGGIIEKEAALHVSNLMLWCEKCKRGVRYGTRVAEDGKKSRVCKKCGTAI
jgi:large subunit ribosomal protein L24